MIRSNHPIVDILQFWEITWSRGNHFQLYFSHEILELMAATTIEGMWRLIGYDELSGEFLVSTSEQFEGRSDWSRHPLHPYRHLHELGRPRIRENRMQAIRDVNQRIGR